MQFFMTTLGAVFMDLKAIAMGSKSSSIQQDIFRDVLPEFKAHLKWMLKGRQDSATATDAYGAPVEITASAESLYRFIKVHYPHLVTSKRFGDCISAVWLATGT